MDDLAGSIQRFQCVYVFRIVHQLEPEGISGDAQFLLKYFIHR